MVVYSKIFKEVFLDFSKKNFITNQWQLKVLWCIRRDKGLLFRTIKLNFDGFLNDILEKCKILLNKYYNKFHDLDLIINKF